MLKGDLTTTPLAPLLLQLADEDANGCVHISDPEGDEALIYFKAGLVYAVSVPGRRPQLGAKLVSSGALAPEALADALEAQRSELQGWRLGELLVHLGYVDQPVVEAFVKEQVHDALWDLIRWTEGRWRFRKNEKTREDVAPPMLVADLLSNLRERGAEWEAISTVVHGPTAVPMLSARGGGAPETTLDADAWSMLCKIDGERSVAELARDCGYTLFEAGQVLVTLVKAGLVDIEEDVDVVAEAAPPAAEDDDDLYGAPSVSSALTAEGEDASGEDASLEDSAETAPEPDGVPAEDAGDEFAALARLVSEVAASTREDGGFDADEVAALDDDDVTADADVDFPAAESAPAERTEDDDVAAAVAAIASLSAERQAESPSMVPLHPLVDDESFAASIARVSSALADVLGPMPEADDPFEVPAELRIKKQPKREKKPVRTPEIERRERLRNAAAAELAAAHALAEALRAGQEEEAAVAEVVNLQDVRREAEEAAARRATEEAEQAAAEEEAARIAAEEEAARIAAEEEAARIAAEEEAARIAAEEEAARVAAEDEAARIAADEEAARVAAEEEAARVAAEDEAARIAAEEEAARIAAEEEAARVAAEEEAARVAAEEEAARIAAEEEAARVEAERAQAEEEAWEEYWRREAEASADAAEAAEAVEETDDEVSTEADVEAEAEAEPVAEEEAEPLEFAVPQLEPDDPEVEATRREVARAEMASATALLVELSAQAVDVPAQATAAEIETSVEDDELDEEEPVAVAVGAPMPEMTDTAALLRELSSLGVEDDSPPPSAPAPRSPSRPNTPAIDPKKKKRGLFGR